MIFYGKAVTDRDKNYSPMIDFIEFEFSEVDPKFLPEDFTEEDNHDVILSCDWQESDWDYDSETGEVRFRCKGVDVNMHPANGHISMFENASIDTIQVYANGCEEFKLAALCIQDGEEFCELKNLTPREIVFSE